MTSNAGGIGRILDSLRSADGRGVVRMEDRFGTDIDDLWSALPRAEFAFPDRCGTGWPQQPERPGSSEGNPAKWTGLRR